MLRPILLCLLIGIAWAARAADPPEPPAGEPEDGMLDEARKEVHDAVELLAREVDSWFGDIPFESGGRVAGRIALRGTWRQDEGSDALLRFGVRVRLPNLEHVGGYLFLGRANEAETVSDRPETFTRSQQLLTETTEEQSFFAGLGASLGKLIALRAGFRGGLKPYAQARLQKLWDIGDLTQFEFRETLFWTVNDGYGSTTSVKFARLLRPSLALRWESAATWAQKNEGMLWGSSVGLYRDYGPLRQLSVEGLFDGQTGIGVGVTQYGVRVRWEQPVYRDWVLLELLAGRFWPKPSAAEERYSAWGAGVGLQMRF
jgi:hypothetical protein